MQLFVYGTLMSAQVIRAVCGYEQTGEPVVANGFKCRTLLHEIYPAIVASHTEVVDGVLYRDLNAAQMALLDTFEGDYYERQSLVVTLSDGTLVEAFGYVLSPQHAHLLSDRRWDYQRFLADGLGAFLAGFPGFGTVGHQ